MGRVFNRLVNRRKRSRASGHRHLRKPAWRLEALETRALLAAHELLLTASGFADGLSSNSPPVANAGAPQIIERGFGLTLDGANSFDPDAGDAIVSWEWDLNGDGSYETSAQPLILSDSDVAAVFPQLGQHTITLRVTDSHGVSAVDTTTVTIVDTFPPFTILWDFPSDPSQSNVSFDVEGIDLSPVTFEYRIDLGTDWTPTGSPTLFSRLLIPLSLPDGTHTFEVRAVDEAGNVDPNPPMYTWTVDGTGPAIDFTQTPPLVSDSPDAHFAISAADAHGVSAVSYVLDSGTPSPVINGQIDFAGLADGQHHLLVRAVDGLGNASTAQYDWTIATAPPINDPPVADPGDPVFLERGSNLALDASGSFDPNAGDVIVRYEWDLNNDGVFDVDLTSPGLFLSADEARAFFPRLATYPIHLRVTDSHGESSSSSTTLTMTDTIRPFAFLLDGPSDSSGPNVSFLVEALDESPVTIEYRIDQNPNWTLAVGPAMLPLETISLTVAEGMHTFEVRAVDDAGNTSDVASRTWTVDASGPVIEITQAPPAVGNSRSAEFHVSATDPNGPVTLEYQLDGGNAWIEVLNGRIVLTGLADGEHALRLQARDRYGNSRSDVYVWKIDTAPPDVSIVRYPNALSGETVATFTVRSSDDEVVKQFEWRVDGGPLQLMIDPGLETEISLHELSPGEHLFEIYAVDIAGNSSSIASFGWTIDIAAPETVILAGPSSSTSSSSATFTVQATDDHGPIDFEYRVDGGDWVLLSEIIVSTLIASAQSVPGEPVTRTVDITVDGLADGEHRFEVRACDAVGNCDATPATRSWTIDTTPPDVSFLDLDDDCDSGPDDSDNITNRTECGFTVTGEPNASVRIVETGADGIITIHGFGDLDADGRATFVISLEEGAHALRCITTDAAGNSSESAPLSVTVDRTSPSPTLVIKPNALGASREATFQWEAADATSVTFEYRFGIDWHQGGTSVTLNVSDGTHTFTVRGTDAAGNTGETSYEFTVDTMGPPVLITLLPPEFTNQTTAQFNFSADDPHGVGAFTCQLDDQPAVVVTGSNSISFQDLSEGTHEFKVYATDSLGNVGPMDTYTWAVDVTGPTTTIFDAPPEFSSSTAATFTFDGDDAGGVASFVYQLDHGDQVPVIKGSALGRASFSNLSEGQHTFSVYSIDRAGNRDDTPATVIWTVDSTPPDTSILSAPPPITRSSTANLVFTSSEPTRIRFTLFLDDGVPVTVEAGPDGTASRQFTGLSAGQHTFTVFAVDAAGNVDDTPAVVTFVVDSSPPELGLDLDDDCDSGPDDSDNITNLQELSLTVTGEPGAGVELTQTRGGLLTIYGRGTFAADGRLTFLVSLPEGPHTITATATDAAGNLSSTELSLVVDHDPPVPLVDGAPPALVNRTTATFDVSAIDNDAVYLLQYSLDGAAFTDLSNPSSVSFVDLHDGEHTFSVRAMDRAGNAKTDVYVWKIKTRIAPVSLDLEATSDSGTSDHDNVTNAQDAQLVVLGEPDASYEVSELGTDGIITIYGRGIVGPDGRATFMVSLPEGQHALQCVTTDPAGNESSSSLSVLVDRTAPVGAISGHNAGVRGETLVYQASTSDDSSGVASTFFGHSQGGTTGPLLTVVPPSAGTYVFDLVVADNAGNTGSAQKSVVVTPTLIRDGQLLVGGTTSKDVISISRSATNLAILLGGSTKQIPASSISQVIVYGQAGDDTISASTRLGSPIWIFGDQGNDRITGGDRDDLLDGGEGNDELYGGLGRDLLIGGVGSDQLNGNGDEELLIGGTTSHDRNFSALSAIMSEWGDRSPAKTYEVRKASLVSGIGSDGSIRLTSATVFDDQQIDTLMGGDGLDWFWYCRTPSGSIIKDRSIDIGPLEFVNETLRGPEQVSTNPPPPGSPPRPPVGGGVQ